jgi:hypothetical protein
MDLPDTGTYVGDPDFHDGHVVKWSRAASDAVVIVRGASGKEYEVKFQGVNEVVAKNAEEMMIYALTQTRQSDGSCRFAFPPWDENSSSRLEIAASAFTVGQISE